MVPCKWIAPITREKAICRFQRRHTSKVTFFFKVFILFLRQSQIFLSYNYRTTTTFLFFQRERHLEKTEIVFTHLFPKCMHQSGLGQATATNQVSQISTKGSTAWAFTFCLPEYEIAGSQNQMQSQDLNQGTLVWNAGNPSSVLTTAANVCPYNYISKQRRICHKAPAW